MEDQQSSFDLRKENLIAYRIAAWSAPAYFVIGIAALALAMIAVPPTGLAYPYLDTLRQYPRDYLWPYAAIVMLALYIVLYGSLSSVIIAERKVIANIGLVFTAMSCLLLIALYYVQESVVPISLMRNETDGLSILTQYNPHGSFIALEEIGYILMLGSIVCLRFLFTGKGRAERAVRSISTIATAGAVLSFAIITYLYGLDKKDRFEIAVILFVWIANLVNSFLIWRIVRKRGKELN